MISASKLMLTLVLLSIAMTSVTTVLGENQWTRYGSTPILSTPSWAPGGLYRPRVLYDGKTFRMWFGGMDAKGNNLGFGYATSTDGMKWVKNAQQILTAGGEIINGGSESWISIGSVIWTGSQFMMWYVGVSAQGAAVGLATSPDGVAWTKYSGNPVMTASSIDWDGLWNPYVIQVGSSFKMWYACLNGALAAESICYATSNDGKSWVKGSSPVLQPLSGWETGGLYSPTVIYDGTVYGMWYTGGNSASSNALAQIGYATSKDGVTWTRDLNNPILPLGPSGAWDAGGVEDQCAVQYNSGFLLYYDGYATAANPSATNPYYIGLAQSPANFVLPESTSPLVMMGVAILIVVTGLSLNKRRLTSRAPS